MFTSMVAVPASAVAGSVMVATCESVADGVIVTDCCISGSTTLQVAFCVISYPRVSLTEAESCAVSPLGMERVVLSAVRL